MTIRSLGATKPSSPSAELGMMVGAMIAAPAVETAAFKNRRRGVLAGELDFSWVMIEFLIVLNQG